MLAVCQSSIERLDLERKVLAAAFKQSFESGDSDGAALAHKGLCAIIQQQLFSGDGSSGSVVPAGFWQKASQALDEQVEDGQLDDGQEAASVNGGEIPFEAGQAVPTIGDAGAAAAEAFAQMASAASDTSPSDAPLADTSASDTPPAEGVPVVAGVTAEELGLTPESQLPLAGPMSYLDFGAEGDEPEELNPAGIGQMLDTLASPETVTPEALSPSQMIKSQSFYQMLGVNKLSSYERIHISFLRLVRRLLRALRATQIRDKREFREVLRSICIAHDVLKDPITRTDYDLRMLGMRAKTGHIEPGADGKSGGLGARIRLMLGELLECANVLEPAELQIALDMHKAEPGMQFGEFLVIANFLNREELDSALMAQRLIDSGKITVAQFQSAMFRMRDSGAAFFDTLMVEGWIQPRDVFDENSELWQDINGPSTGSNSGNGDGASYGGTGSNATNEDTPSDKRSGDWADNVEWVEEAQSAPSAESKQKSNDLMQAALEAERELLSFIDTPQEPDADLERGEGEFTKEGLVQKPVMAVDEGTEYDTTPHFERSGSDDDGEDEVSQELDNLARTAGTEEFMNSFLAEAQDYESSDVEQHSHSEQGARSSAALMGALDALPDAKPDLQDEQSQRETLPNAPRAVNAPDKSRSEQDNDGYPDSETDPHSETDQHSQAHPDADEHPHDAHAHADTVPSNGDEGAVKIGAPISAEKLGAAARLLEHIKGKKVEFSDKWTEKDAMAETQSIDMTAVKAMIDSHRSEDKD